MSYEEKIERGLKLYLREEHGIFAVEAEIGLTEFERGYFDGCETCGYGADEDEVYTPIFYKREGDSYRRTLRLDGTNVSLLPLLLPYIDRAN